MKKVCSAFVVSLAIIVCLPSILAQSTELSTASPQSALLLRLRDMASASYMAFKAGNSELAAQTAHSLEHAWDAGSPLSLIAPDLSEATDRAMDAFIGPLIRYANMTPDKEAVNTAYEAYMAKLDEGLRDLSDQSLNIRKTQSGVIYIVTKAGTGRQPKSGEIVILDIAGFADGIEFRRTVDESKPDWVWLLGDRQPPGFLEGMTLLHKGESAIIIIPSGLGFGPNGGYHGKVPPNAQLTYFVKLLDVKSHEMDDLLLQTIMEKGIDAAVEQFRALRERGFPDVYCNEDQVNGLGYDLLNKGDTEDAIKILTLNAETFPNSANVFDSLGEAYAKNGDREKAIENYQKALAIDPKMESSLRALNRLQSN